MSKKRWILIILAILIGVASACFLLPGKIGNDCQDKIDACVESQEEGVKQICPIDCNYYEENFVVGVNSQDEFIQEPKEDVELKGDKDVEEPEEELNDVKEIKEDKNNEELKDLNTRKPEGKRFEENKRKEPESTGAIQISEPTTAETKTGKDCPEGKVLRCPMGLCLNFDTGETYPCQSSCFCVSPDTYF